MATYGPVATLVTFLILHSAAGGAEFTATQAIAARAKGDPVKFGIEMMAVNLQDGMGWYAASSNVRLYCQPIHLALNGSQIMDMVEAEVIEHRNFGTLPLGLVILQALKTTFPCAAGSN